MNVKKRKFRPVLAIILVALSSATVGFSSWAIVNDISEKTGDVGLGTGEINMRSQDFIKTAASSYQYSFSYNAEYGFLDDEEYGNTCYLIASFYIDIAGARSGKYVTNNNIMLSGSITCDSDSSNTIRFVDVENSATKAKMNVYYASGIGTNPPEASITSEVGSISYNGHCGSYRIPAISLVNGSGTAVQTGNLFVRFKFVFVFENMSIPMVDGAFTKTPSFKITLGAVQ